jgi:hypothetical protein
MRRLDVRLAAGMTKQRRKDRLRCWIGAGVSVAIHGLYGTERALRRHHGTP